MESSVSLSLALTSITLKDQQTGQTYTILVPVDFYSKVTNDVVLAGKIFCQICQSHPMDVSEKQKTLSSAQSIQLLAGMGLLNDLTQLSVPQPTASGSGSGRSTPAAEGCSQESDREEEKSPEDSADRVIWAHSSVLLLVDLRRRNQGLFSNNCVTQKQAWRKISEMMKAEDKIYSGEDCSKKFRNMKDRYKKIKDSRSKTGRGRKVWQYYSLMDEFFEGDPCVNPIGSVASMPQPQAHSVQLQQSEQLELQVAAPSAPATPSAACSPALPPSTPTTPTTPRTPKPAKRRRTAPPSKEPEWFSQFREDQQAMHRERMELEKKKLELEERRVKALEALAAAKTKE